MTAHRRQPATSPGALNWGLRGGPGNHSVGLGSVRGGMSQMIFSGQFADGVGVALLAFATAVWSGAMSSSTLARAATLAGPRRAVWTLAGAAVAANGLWANYYLSALAVRADLPAAIVAFDAVIAALSVHLACAFSFLMIVYRGTRGAALLGAAVLGANVLLMQYVGLRSFNLDPARLFDLGAVGPSAALLAAVFVASALAYRPDVPPVRRYAGVVAVSGLVTALNLLILAASPLAAGAPAADLSSGSIKSVVFIVTCLLIAGIAAAYATDKLLAERELHLRALDDAIAGLRESERAANAANAAKSEFVADISHEIRTPLTAVLGMLDLLYAPGLTLDQRRHLAIAKTASEGLLTLANDLVDLAKLEAGRLTTTIAPCDVAGVARSVLDLMAPALAGRDVSFGLEVEDSFPAAVLTDGGRLRQILVNLVGNAIKYTERGAITIVLGARPSDAGAFDLTVAVADTGVGMPAGALDRLFERFSQVSADGAPRRPGAGLGLAISRKLAAALGGVLAADSRPGVGSRFALTFRAELAAVAPVHTADPPAAGLQPGDIEPVHLLIVDDQESNRFLAARLLRRFGITAEIADGATAALDRLRSRPFDAVLLDLHMPEIDGIAAAQAIRALEGPAGRVPLIAFSAAVGATDRRRCMEAGIMHFVEKPIRPAALYAAVMAAVNEFNDEKENRMDAINPAAAPPVVDYPMIFIDSFKLYETVALIGADEAQALSSAAFLEIGRLLTHARAALAGGDLAEAKAAAHAVKGVAANWAAMRLSEDARQLEVGAPDVVTAEATLDAMVRSWCGARAHLPALIAAAPVKQSAA